MNNSSDNKSEAIVARFQMAWLQGHCPELSDFVPNPADHSETAYQAILVQLVKIDLESQWQDDLSEDVTLQANSELFPQRPTVDDYIAKFPELGSAGSLLVDLILTEYRIRSRTSKKISLEEYLDKFPALESELQSAFANFDQEDTLTVSRNPQESPLEDVTVLPSKANESLPNTGDRVRYFGEYELLSEIARGGMGVVFKARQTRLKRTVALKMILSGEFAGDEEIERFKTEAEAAANLDHPGIVPIFEIGDQDGQHYFSMGFVEGQSLGDLVKDSPLPSKKAAEMLKKVAEAVSYAHEHGVIHRDLKPDNVLIDTNGEPRVTDFGLAKQVQSDRDLTQTGAVMGTPSYMPPEQASGSADVGTTADVYSLGAVLYAVLTGRPPFQSANVVDVIMQVLEREPVPPRQLDSQIEGDLETICLKCLAKNPESRYRSSQEFADDLGRYLRDEPITARPPGVWERATQWARNNVVTVTTIMLLLMSSVVVIPLGYLLLDSQFGSITMDQDDTGLEADENEIPEILSSRGATIIKEMSDLIDDNPANGSALFERGKAFIAQGKFASAIDDLSSAIKYENHRADFYFMRGLARFRLKQFNASIKDYSKTIELDPDSFEAHFRRAVAWFNVEDFPKSLEDINLAIALRPGYGEAYLWRGRIYHRMNNKDRARKDFAKAERLGVNLTATVD